MLKNINTISTTEQAAVSAKPFNPDLHSQKAMLAGAHVRIGLIRCSPAFRPDKS